MNKKEFKIAQSADSGYLEAEVNELINNGWKIINVFALFINIPNEQYVNFCAFLTKENTPMEVEK